MTERPILFSAAMVRALLAGTKTQTRRIVKPQPHSVALVASGNHLFDYRDDLGDYSRVVPMDKAVTLCPHGKPGERLWVREAWRTMTNYDGLPPLSVPTGAPLQYLADGDRPVRLAGKTRVSIHMPRWASRITLEITEVRVERLQAIAEMDAYAEGIDTEGHVYNEAERAMICGVRSRFAPSVIAYACLWDSINGPGSWDSNPWVWALSFKVVKP